MVVPEQNMCAEVSDIPTNPYNLRKLPKEIDAAAEPRGGEAALLDLAGRGLALTVPLLPFMGGIARTVALNFDVAIQSPAAPVMMALAASIPELVVDGLWSALMALAALLFFFLIGSVAPALHKTDKAARASRSLKAMNDAEEMHRVLPEVKELLREAKDAWDAVDQTSGPFERLIESIPARWMRLARTLFLLAFVLPLVLLYPWPLLVIGVIALMLAKWLQRIARRTRALPLRRTWVGC